MKVLLDVKDGKAPFVMELLSSLPFVKAVQLTDANAQLISEVREALTEMQLIKAGKKEAQDATEFLNALRSKSH